MIREMTNSERRRFPGKFWTEICRCGRQQAFYTVKPSEQNKLTRANAYCLNCCRKVFNERMVVKVQLSAISRTMSISDIGRTFAITTRRQPSVDALMGDRNKVFFNALINSITASKGADFVLFEEVPDPGW